MARNKFIPQWIKNLSSDILAELLRCFNNGDAAKNNDYKCGTYYQVSVFSKQLVEDIAEIAYKCGYSPKIVKHKGDFRTPDGRWCANFGDGPRGRFPIVKRKQISKINYTGKTWCFQTSTGYFVTRRSGKISISMNSYEWVGACYIEDIEVMTRRGFLPYRDVLESEEIATINLGTGNLEYQKYVSKFEYDYDSEKDGKLIHFDGRDCDIIVTQNHKMVVGGPDGLNLVEANCIKNGNLFLTSVNKEQSSGKTIDLASIDTRLAGLSLVDFLKLSGRYLSARNKIRTKKSPCSNDVQEYLKENFGTQHNEIKIPQWVLDLDIICGFDLGIIVEAFIGDLNKKKRQIIFSATLVDQFQAILFRLGYKTKIFISFPVLGEKDIKYHLSWSIGGTTKIGKNNIKQVDYTGKVWCFEVPNHAFIVRRNGKIGIHGNSGKVLQLTKEYELIEKNIIQGMGVNEAILSACIPETSGILTNNGVKYLNTFDIEKDLVATLNLESNQVEYQKAEIKYVYNYDSIEGPDAPMIAFKHGRDLDNAFTANHDMLVYRLVYWVKIHAEDVIEGDEIMVNDPPMTHTYEDYTVMFNDQRRSVKIKQSMIDEFKWSGKIWCVQVPNGTILCENNGKFVWTGNSGPSYPVDDETQLLTERGFLSRTEFDPEKDLVATYNKEKNSIEFQKAIGKYEHDHDSINGNDQDLYYFKTARINFMCTHNHRMFVQRQKSYNEKTNEWEVIPAEQVVPSMHFKSSVKNWVGTIPNIVHDLCLGNSLDDFLKISAAFISEGCYRKNHRDKNSIKYEFNGKKRNKSEKMGIIYSQSEKSKNYNIF
ncbi:MAG: hypothetical protein Q7R33_07130, partial [Nitrosarchaeum sp.]|nr:hypothetical protein [Nitrosarchaeum sp.]